MLYTIPDYYHDFHCIAGACGDTCCAGWQIVIDHKSLNRYRAVKGPYRKKLSASIRWRRGVFRQDANRRCACLTEDNLCEMYQNLGGDSLCRTCRLYPRHIEEFEGVREISLSLSCPEAARILMNRKTPVTFRQVERPGEENFDGFDPFLYSELLDVREQIIALLQNRSLPVANRIILSLGLAWDVQNRVKSGRLFSCGEVLERYKCGKYEAAAARRAAQWAKAASERMGFSRTMLSNLFQLERLEEAWEVQLNETAYLLLGRGPETYQKRQADFAQWLENSGLDWEIKGEQLLVYFIFTYFCGAVYDGQIFAGVQMAAASVALLWDMLAARWLKNGGLLEEEEIIDLVYRYSREVEHSDKNLKLLWRLLEEQEELFFAD